MKCIVQEFFFLILEILLDKNLGLYRKRDERKRMMTIEILVKMCFWWIEKKSEMLK